MASPLQGDVTVTGYDQHSLVTLLGNIKDLLNEIQANYATNKTTVDALRTLAVELRTDHATQVTLNNELMADHATFVALTAANKTAINAIITAAAATDGLVSVAAVTPVSASAVATLTAGAVATITAGAPATGPAALTNSTAITLLRS